MEYRSYNDLTKAIITNLSIIPKDVEIIVGVPRSGLLVANIISLLLNKPLTDLNGFVENRLISSGKTKNCKSFIEDCHSAKKVLIIEDSLYSGASIIECKQKLKRFEQKIEIVYGCVYIAPGKEDLVDFYLEKVQMPRLFEWNIFHHAILENACFDIDGVLCDDPTSEQNDDGPEYIKFLLNAKPKIIPSVQIGALVTSRLDKYENETRLWMKQNNVKYRELVMLHSTFEERRAKGNHAEFKAEYYKKNNYSLFVESEPNQARRIQEISHKPVYCIGNGEFYDGSLLYKINKEDYLLQIIKRFVLKSSLGRYLYKKYKES